MYQGTQAFKDIITNIMSYSIRCWVYLPNNDEWTLESKSAVLESEEVPPELESVPDAGVPAFAIDNSLMQALPVSEVQDIVNNAKQQKTDISIDEIFEAFLYYYDNDAYMTIKV